jgi:hypothetical protein
MGAMPFHTFGELPPLNGSRRAWGRADRGRGDASRGAAPTSWSTPIAIFSLNCSAALLLPFPGCLVVGMGGVRRVLGASPVGLRSFAPDPKVDAMSAATLLAGACSCASVSIATAVSAATLLAGSAGVWDPQLPVITGEPLELAGLAGLGVSTSKMSCASSCNETPCVQSAREQG